MSRYPKNDEKKNSVHKGLIVSKVNTNRLIKTKKYAIICMCHNSNDYLLNISFYIEHISGIYTEIFLGYYISSLMLMSPQISMWMEKWSSLYYPDSVQYIRRFILR